jgi:tight adherence protein C
VTLLIPLLGFAFITLLITACAMAMAPRHAVAIEQRLGELSGRPDAAARDGAGYERMIATLRRIGQMAPKSPSEMGRLQRKLVAAGYRGKEAVIVFVGLRAGCALAAFAITSMPFVGRQSLLLSLSVAGLGYLLPTMVLGRLAKKRQHRIRLSLPDALDLLVVSVEAGLGLDQAIQRVADELEAAHPDLAGELRLVNLEMRAGTERAEALHNLGERTGVDDVVSLVAMLVQTDRFGTSVAQSLRVHSDTLRTKRRQRAEEAAAKTGVKMVFPLVFCIFPAIWVVAIGPAAISFMKVIVPMSSK